MSTQRERSPARTTLTVIGLVLLTLLGLLLVYEARRVLTWIVIAVFFAVALHPAATWVERHVSWCRRWLSTLVIFLLVSVVLAGLTTLFVLPLIREVGQFADELPGFIRDARAGRGPVGGLVRRFHLVQYVQTHQNQLRGYVSGLGAPTLSFIRGAITTVAGTITIFVLAYLMVLEGPRVVTAFLGLLEPRQAERVHRVGSACARTITGYITGNLLISVICGVLTYVVLLVTGVPFAALIALFVAIADLIPLVGATLGAVVAAIAGFLHSITAGIVVIVFFIVYQQVENHLLQPVILSRTVRLDPLTVLVSILIAAELAGILGTLLAIPVAGMVKIIAHDIWHERRGGRGAEPVAAEGETAERETAKGEAPAKGGAARGGATESRATAGGRGPEGGQPA